MGFQRYTWKNGTRHKVDANVAGKVFEKLQDEGRLNAEAVVKVSTPKNAPLHVEFEWRNSVAGHEWRKHQARNLMNGIAVVEIVREEHEPQQIELAVPEKEVRPETRAFFRLAPGENYESLMTIMNSNDKRKALLDMALRELETFQKKYQILSELSAVFDAIDMVKAKASE